VTEEAKEVVLWATIEMVDCPCTSETTLGGVEIMTNHAVITAR
jgi:hypothetical protein